VSESRSILVRVGERVLHVLRGGADQGVALVFHWGTPSPPVRWDSLSAAARQRGLSLISYARPGYSRSTRDRGRSVADAAADTAVVLDALGAGEFVAVGHSGGGPHALACAALLADRCLAAVSVAGLAPFDADDIDWMAGMDDESVEEHTTALTGEAALDSYLQQSAEPLSAVTAEEIAVLLPEVDRIALAEELADVLVRSLRLGVAEGIDGWLDDELAFVKPWGFDLGLIRVPVAVWHGRDDRMVPFAHGEWLHTHLATSRSRFLEDEGHVSLLANQLGGILNDLVEMSQTGDT